MKKNIKKILRILDIRYLILLMILSFLLFGGIETVSAVKEKCCLAGGQCVLLSQMSGGGCGNIVECETKPGCPVPTEIQPLACSQHTDCQNTGICLDGFCSKVADLKDSLQQCNTDTDCHSQNQQGFCVKAPSVSSAYGSMSGPSTCFYKTFVPEKKIKWQPIAPKLQINIPTLQPFTTKGMETADAEGNVYIPFIGLYIAGIYRWAVLIAAIVAAVFVMFGGFIYLTSGGNAERAKEGRDRITQALFGLLILLGSYVLLYTINPDLVRFKSLKIKVIERKEIEITDVDAYEAAKATGVAPAAGASSRVCDTVETCSPYCNGPESDKQKVDQKIDEIGLAKPGDIKPVSSLIQGYLKKYQPNCTEPLTDCGIYFRTNIKNSELLPSAIDGLAYAATKAKEAGYILNIGSTYRSPYTQMGLVCKAIAEGNLETNGKPCGPTRACPFGSPHGAGYAVDLCLATKEAPSNCLTLPSGDSRSCEQNLPFEHNNSYQLILNKIMFSANWYKYCMENWHFEYISKASNSLRVNSAEWTQ